MKDLDGRGFLRTTEAGFAAKGAADADRFADVPGYNPSTGAVEIIQVGDFAHTLGVPIGRERDALLDILKTDTNIEAILREQFEGRFTGITSINIRFVEKLTPP